MHRARNPIHFPDDASRRKSNERIGLCGICGMPVGRCLHDTLRSMMDPLDYAGAGGDTMPYDQVRDRIAAIKTARANRDQHGKGEAIRITTDRLVWTPAHEKGK